MNIKKMLMASFLVGPLAGHSVSGTGFYVGVLLGGTHVGMKSFFRKDGAKKADQVEYGDVKAFAPSFGGELSGGFEVSSIFVGAKIYGGATIKDLKTEENKRYGNISLTLGDATSATNYKSFVAQTVKVKAFYGGAIQVGGKLSQGCIAYASFGVEGTYVKVTQEVAVVAANTDAGKKATQPAVGFAINNGSGSTYDGSHELLKSFITSDVKGLNVAPTNVEVKGKTLLSLVPGVGGKYIFASGVFVGVQADLQIGVNSKVNEEMFDKDTKVTTTTGDTTEVKTEYTFGSAKSQKINLYYKQPIGCRVGLTLGYKF
ncbi:MAG: hypothetical protein LBJ89_02050 [Holosporales bacterium]|jgi:hypothetical protein|nr:hypothetical protein [Holosporales bacterium]